MGNKRKTLGIGDSILLFLFAVGAIFVAIDGWLIARVMQIGGTDNLAIQWEFLALGLGMCSLAVVGKLFQFKMSDWKS